MQHQGRRHLEQFVFDRKLCAVCRNRLKVMNVTLELRIVLPAYRYLFLSSLMTPNAESLVGVSNTKYPNASQEIAGLASAIRCMQSHRTVALITCK
jgi:hypothetical protein